MNRFSQPPKEERIKALYDLIPEAFTEGKIDFEKLRAALGDDVEFSTERYLFSWAGKSNAFRVLQEPSSATLAPCREKSVDFDKTQNLYIEGENMEVLKVLQRSYSRKIKMIYIDPPYNTGSDSFIYPDKFSEKKKNYQRRVGDVDKEGYRIRDGFFHKNTKENGYIHSNWLSMMMPRLYLAKSLLREDGVIFISIDDHESHNLRLLMDEVFGEENFIVNFIWQSKYTVSNDAKYVSYQHENVLMYARDKSKFTIGKTKRTEAQNKNYRNPDNDPNGPWKPTPLHAKSGNENSKYTVVFKNGVEWTCPRGRYPRYKKEDLLTMYDNGELYFNSNGGVDRRTYLKDVAKKGVVVGSFLKDDKPEDKEILESSVLEYSEVGHTHENNDELAELLGKGVFDNPKGTRLIRKLCTIANLGPNDIVFDFFSGSVTTALAVMELNAEDGGHRKFAMVQIEEKCDKVSKDGVKFTNICQIGEERLRLAGERIRARYLLSGRSPVLDVGFKVFKLVESNFKQWQETKSSDIEGLALQMSDFQDSTKSSHLDYEGIAYELLVKSGKDLNSTIEHKDGYYAVNGSELVLLLEPLNRSIIDAVIALRPRKVIALDQTFGGDDPLKTNTVLQMRDAHIEFESI